MRVGIAVAVALRRLEWPMEYSSLMGVRESSDTLTVMLFTLWLGWLRDSFYRCRLWVFLCFLNRNELTIP
ncbi:hypothetical protein A1D17_02315 [Pseudomonas fluorescens]|uniref:Uncharacterized protein n=1 Tax=Pseudomonas fluorescens TaxID=294 RepID=A0A166R4A0_PSEFL|nr:hypothetical protein A1D17_02315 [Pseudomonas fluorescens]